MAAFFLGPGYQPPPTFRCEGFLGPRISSRQPDNYTYCGL